MKCDKDILQPFFEDPNKSTSTLVIGYHSLSSVTDLLQDIKYVHAVSYQEVLLEHLDP